MTREIRFGAFLREVRAHQNQISFNDLVPEPIIDKDGNKVYPPAPVVKVHPLDVYRLMQPYLTTRVVEQLKSVAPLAVYLMLFQLLILRQGLDNHPTWARTPTLVRYSPVKTFPSPHNSLN